MINGRRAVTGRIDILLCGILEREESGRRFRFLWTIVLGRFLLIGSVNGPYCYNSHRNVLCRWFGWGSEGKPQSKSADDDIICRIADQPHSEALSLNSGASLNWGFLFTSLFFGGFFSTNFLQFSNLCGSYTHFFRLTSHLMSFSIS